MNGMLCSLIQQENQKVVAIFSFNIFLVEYIDLKSQVAVLTNYSRRMKHDCNYSHSQMNKESFKTIV